jgi:hypothetical protein
MDTCPSEETATKTPHFRIRTTELVVARRKVTKSAKPVMPSLTSAVSGLFSGVRSYSANI